MRNLKKMAAISLTVLICSPAVLSYADKNEVNAKAEIVEQTKEEKPEILKLTVSEAVKRSLENSFEMKNSNLELLKAEVSYKEGKYDIRENKKNFEAMDINEKYAAYINGVTIAEFANDFALENSKRQNEIVKENIKNEVEKIYFDVIQAGNMIDINKSNMNLSKRLSEISQIKLDLGLGVKQEVVNSELNYTKAKESYEQSVKNLEDIKMLFNVKLGLDISQKVELLDSIECKDFELEDIDESIKKALENRSEIKSAEFNLELQKLKLKTEYPSITFNYRKLEAEINKAKESLETARANIEMEIRSSYKEISQKKLEINSAQKTVELANEGLRAAKVSYELGLGIRLDVEQSQNALEQAKLGLSNAILKYNLESLKIKSITGLGKIVGGM